MPLSNAQFDSVMRRIEARRDLAEATAAAERAELSEKLPAYSELARKAVTLEVMRARARIERPDADVTAETKELSKLREEQTKLLQANGYPADFGVPRYHCPLCEDRGLLEGRPCQCFRAETTRYLAETSGLSDLLAKENFETFALEKYSDKIKSELTGKTARETAKDAYDAARNFIARMGEKENNLFLYGNTGVGKSFLTHCIADELLEANFTVLYFSAQDLFDLLADEAFGRDVTGSALAKTVFSCDCLMVDDLGTELTNSFVASKLFHIVNERFLAGLAMVISTNLTLEEFREKYTERVFSRISGHYQMIKLIGEDLRLSGA